MLQFLQVCRNLRTFVVVPENLRFTHLGAKKNCESWVPSQKNRISSHGRSPVCPLASLSSGEPSFARTYKFQLCEALLRSLWCVQQKFQPCLALTPSLNHHLAGAKLQEGDLQTAHKPRSPQGSQRGWPPPPGGFSSHHVASSSCLQRCHCNS